MDQQLELLRSASGVLPDLRDQAAKDLRTHSLTWFLAFWLGLYFWGGAARGERVSDSGSVLVPEVVYKNYRDPKGPRSIHVVRVPRGGAPFQIVALHAGGRAVGLSPLSEQVLSLASALGTPVAGINGDFYKRSGPYAGDPRGMLISEGELISAPAGSAGFWIDAVGEPHITNTVSLLRVTWPDGSTSPIGLNGARLPNGIELYTPALGPSTHTAGGREFVLEQQDSSPWLPLRPGKTYHARVRHIRQTGNSQIVAGTMVLSIGPGLAQTSPPLQPGAELVLSTETRPSLRGAKTAISGGPILIRDGRRQRIKDSGSDAYESSSMMERHPRAAIGWNEESFFLVEVDGRQRNLSVGMTLDELSSFLAQLGCKDALNLDGGGSATLWYKGRVQNRPCDGYERPIANSLVVLKKEAASLEQDKIQPAPPGLSP